MGSSWRICTRGEEAEEEEQENVQEEKDDDDDEEEEGGGGKTEKERILCSVHYFLTCRFFSFFFCTQVKC